MSAKVFHNCRSFHKKIATIVWASPTPYGAMVLLDKGNYFWQFDIDYTNYPHYNLRDHFLLCQAIAHDAVFNLFNDESYW